ncbi:MAG TPA: ATP-binding protein, partial [Actinomycetota bacterium]|nr:ATP-binding protein [Actinomycetota bacterium]
CACRSMADRAVARTLLDRERMLDESQRATALSAIERHAHGLMDFSRDIMEILQAEEGALPLTRAPLDLGGAAAAALERIRKDFPDHRFGLDVERTHLTVCADPRRIGQVIENLLGNAAKYSPPGTLVSVTVRRGPDHVVVAVSDAGPPLPGDIVAAPFTRRGPRDDSGGGNGLGLYLCRVLVESMGGRIWAENRPGMVVVGFLLPVSG